MEGRNAIKCGELHCAVAPLDRAPPCHQLPAVEPHVHKRVTGRNAKRVGSANLDRVRYLSFHGVFPTCSGCVRSLDLLPVIHGAGVDHELAIIGPGGLRRIGLTHIEG